jgi:hypothetical protein
VFLTSSPEIRGTITRLSSEEFRVTWDSVDRKPGQKRVRRWYAEDALSTGMKIGVPA